MNWTSIWFLALPVALLALVIALVAFVIRGKAPEERVQLLAHATKWGAWAVAGFATLSSAREIYRALFSESVPVRIETSPFWPTLPNEVSAVMGSAQVDELSVQDGFTQANIHLIGLSATTRGLIALDSSAQLVAVVVLCLLIARVASGVDRGRVFDSVRGKDLVVSGAIFLVSGITATLTNGFSQSAILSEARPRQFSFDDMSWTVTATDAHTQVFGIVSWSWGLSAPVWTFVAAAVAFIAAMVMRRGSQLETDTKGLI